MAGYGSTQRPHSTMSTSVENIPATCKTLVQEVRDTYSENRRSHDRVFRGKTSFSRKPLSQK